MSSDGTDLTIPITALADYGLTAALAHQTTGDARAMAYAFAARIEDWYRSLASADRPTALTADTTTSVQLLTSTTFPGASKEVIKITTYRTRPDGTVEDEP